MRSVESRQKTSSKEDLLRRLTCRCNSVSVATADGRVEHWDHLPRLHDHVGQDLQKEGSVVAHLVEGPRPVDDSLRHVDCPVSWLAS